MHSFRGVLGLLTFMGIAWLLSSNRRRFPFKVVFGGLLLQFSLALLVLRTAYGAAIFDALGAVVTLILQGADAGADFVFGPLAGNSGGAHPEVQWVAIAGIKILATIIVFSTLSAIGYHYGVLQRVVAALAWVMSRLLRVSGAESLSCAANVFLGQTEAPMLVRPYIAGMTRSELMAVMTGGFATIAMGVMGLYVSWLGVGPDGAPDQARAIEVARHLLTASLMSAPAAFIMAKVMIPETEVAQTGLEGRVETPRLTRNGLDAATVGAGDGMRLAINVIAMLIAFIALVKLIDLGLVGLGGLESRYEWLGSAAERHGAWQALLAAIYHPVGWLREQCGGTLSLGAVLGLVFGPFAWLIGAEAGQERVLGSLLGTAMATNEMFAYARLAELVRTSAATDHTAHLAYYSLCGFANISSMGIQIAGIGSMAPERRNDLVSLAPRAMIGGALASWMTGCIAGMLT